MGSYIRWTLDLVKLSASKYETKSDWYKAESKAYKAAHNNGWIPIVTEHMKRKKKESILAKEYSFNSGNKKEYDRLRYLRLREKRRKQGSDYYKANKKRKNEYQKRRRREDIQYRLTCIIRCSLNDRFRKTKRCVRPTKHLGCSIQELKTYLESKFQPGMTWENYGLHGWHIDHIKPLASFDLTDLEQVKSACHYTNLQPLWAKDNIRKSDNV